MKKRRIKLLASLTSLVLVVAVMAVGVWAATNAAVGITTNVTFTATNHIETLIDVKSGKTTDGTPATANTNVAQGYITNGNPVTERGVAYTQNFLTTGTVNIANPDFTNAGTESGASFAYAITFTNQTKSTATNGDLTINLDKTSALLTALAAEDVNYTLTISIVAANTEEGALTEITAETSTAEDIALATLHYNGTLTLTVVFTVDDMATSVGETSLDVSFNLVAEA